MTAARYIRSTRRSSISSGVGFGVRSSYSAAPPPSRCAVGDAAHDERLLPSKRPADHDRVAGANRAVGLRGLPVHVDLAVRDGLLRFRSCLEQAGDIEPDVQRHGEGLFGRRSSRSESRNDVRTAAVSSITSRPSNLLGLFERVEGQAPSATTPFEPIRDPPQVQEQRVCGSTTTSRSAEVWGLGGRRRHSDRRAVRHAGRAAQARLDVGAHGAGVGARRVARRRTACR